MKILYRERKFLLKDENDECSSDRALSASVERVHESEYHYVDLSIFDASSAGFQVEWAIFDEKSKSSVLAQLSELIDGVLALKSAVERIELQTSSLPTDPSE